jgi:hypothetical protein
MSSEDTDLIKYREIAFNELHPDPRQAHTAALLLTGIEGILETRPLGPTLLQISYNILDISLEQIESALADEGFNLSCRLVHRLKRALYYYTEETQRANSGCDQPNCKCTRNIFINRYNRLNHDCRDPRPEHWRKYL